MSKQYTQSYLAMGSNSTSTSNAWFCGDFRLVSVSVNSSASLGPTNVIIQGSNADGLRAGDLGGPSQSTNWSNLTIILPGSLNAGGNVGSGLFTFDPPGFRWMRSIVSSTLQSVASAMTVIFNGESF